MTIVLAVVHDFLLQTLLNVFIQKNVLLIKSLFCYIPYMFHVSLVIDDFVKFAKRMAYVPHHFVGYYQVFNPLMFI